MTLHFFQYTGAPSVNLLKRTFAWLKPAAEKVKLWDGKRKQHSRGKSDVRKRKALTFEEFVLSLLLEYGEVMMMYCCHTCFELRQARLEEYYQHGLIS